MKKITAIKMVHYNGFKKEWNKEKEIMVDNDKVETVLQGNEEVPTHWMGNTRIVLKDSWEKLQDIKA